MTNLLILSLQILTTNLTGKDCTLTYTNGQAWYSSNICYQATFTYTAPAGTYNVQYRSNIGFIPENLNQPLTNNVAGTNTVTFPIPPSDTAFFQLKGT